MNIRQRVLGTVGAVALGLSFVPSLAIAQQVDDDIENTVVNVICPPAATVNATQNAPFTVNSGAGETSDSVVNGITIVVDTTCNWSPWEVGASIGTFAYQGVAPANTVPSFSGTLFLMDNGGLDSYTGPTGVVSLIPPIAAAPPSVEASVFELLQTSDPNIIDSDTVIIFDVAAPGVSTATWDAHLNLLPLNLAQGQYIAPLTVTLTLT